MMEAGQETAVVQSAAEVTIFVVDDGAAMRESLRWLLESVGLRVETYASAEEFLERFDATKPGCIVLDVKMPAMDGLDLQNELARRDVFTPIIFITAYGEVSHAVRACKGGAVDFIEKPFSDQVLLEAIRDALDRDMETRRQLTDHAVFAERKASLTARELDVMQGVIAGKTNREMATELGLSPRTVEVHRGRLMEKLHVSSVAELVRSGLKGGDTPAAAERPRRRRRSAPQRPKRRGH
jgi:two-component system response regulator FixJ